jgi:integrase
MLAKIEPYDRVVEATLLTVAVSSRRIYQSTYSRWTDWCHNHRIEPLHLHPVNIQQFLIDQHVTRRTRLNQMSAMRALVKTLAILQPDMKPLYEIVKASHIPVENLTDSERNLTALTTVDARRVLGVWSGSDAISVRNYALIALLLATGLRRAEAGALEWRDVDLDAGTAKVRHGKGDKPRDVALVGDYSLAALRAWRNLCASDQRYVFAPLDNQGRVTIDRPMSGANIYRVVKVTQQRSGVAFSPHDLRRTLATELLVAGASIADVQEQLGHADSSTTLRYARAASAQERRRRFKTRYGD